VEGFAIEATGDCEKLDEFVDVMRSYGDIEVTRSGIVAVSLEAKKLRLAPPVPRGVVDGAPRKEEEEELNGEALLRKER
jgi:acetolactate synthase-1/3 small subunit